MPYAELFSAFAPFVMTPVLDGQFLSRLPSKSFSAGLVADVAILAGSNTDEGTATFFGPRGTLETDVDVHSLLSGMGTGLDNKTVSEAMALYPDDPSLGCPFGTGSERFAQLGYMYKRGAAIVGDEVIHAGRRLTIEFYSSRSSSYRKPVYSYRFDQSPWNGVEVLVATEAPVYATHYSEVRLSPPIPCLFNCPNKIFYRFASCSISVLVQVSITPTGLALIRVTTSYPI